MSTEIARVASFTIGTGLLATALMLPFGIAIGWVLARHRFPGKALLETAITLPLVMPPVAVGLVLLRLFGRRGPVGSVLHGIGIDVIFTWKAVVLAMSVMALPLLVRTVRAGFEQVDRRYEHIAATLGATPVRTFVTISLPLAGRTVLAGAILGFSRALGEFGATVMVAGALPGTSTLGVSIYRFTEIGRDDQAMALVAISTAIAFVAVLVSNRITRGASG